MVIKRIRLKNFRNYASADAEFAPGINLVTGSNAQGKTNLLESILLSCVGKSVRGKDKELIRTGCARAFIKMETSRSSGDVTTELVLSRTENKRIAVNGASLQRTSELLGIVGAIYFCPDDLKLVKDAPESRRRFLDLDLSQVYKSYHHALTRYNKALLSRNNILKRYPERQLTDLCYPYDAQLAREGSKIAIMRADYVKLLGEESERVHLQLTSGAEKLETVYQTGADLNPQTAEESYFKKLAANLEKDAKLKFTTFGIHRDDLKLSVDGIDIRVYGSQGQQRTAALSLKLAELELFRSITGEYPVLLLDDVLSELDRSRQRRLLELCANVQSVITATHIEPGLADGLDCRVLKVSGGTVAEQG